MKYLALLLLIGCASPVIQDDIYSRSMKPTQVSALISDRIEPRNINLFFSDESYTVFSNRSYFRAILDDYRKHSFNSGVRYSKRYDCEDFARGMQHFFQVRYGKSKHRGQSFALGVANYRTDEGFNHSLCVALIGDEVLFVEPQRGHFVELSKKERESLFSVNF